MTDDSEEKSSSSRIALQGWISMGFVLLTVLIAPVRMAILTRSLAKADYGLFSLLSIAAASLGFVGALGLRQFLIYVLPGKTKDEQGGYLVSCFVLTLSVSALIGVAFVVAGHTVPSLTADFSSLLILSGAVYILLYALANLGQGYILAVGEFVRYRVLNFSMTCLWLFLALPVILLGNNSVEMMAWLWVLGLAITLGLTAWIVMVKIGKSIFATPRLQVMRDGLRYGVPMLPRYFALALFRLADRFVILAVIGAEEVALYTVAATLVFFAAETSYFLEFMLPHISEAWNANVTRGQPGCTGKASEHFHMTLRLSLLTSIPLMVGLLLWGKDIVEILAGSSFSHSSVVFPVMAPVVPVIAFTSIFQFAISLDGKTLRVGNSILAASVLNLFLNVVLVRQMGIEGAALATTVSYVALLTCTMAMSRLLPYFKLAELRIGRLAVSALAMAGTALLMRRAIGHFSLVELPLACLAFLACGLLVRLWTINELKAIRRGK
ncbi:MAG: hypothetical protein EOM20_02045 [Spartobacteria bacterium]|nr:hypothetical protein [Spartobacteria bacterium]